MAKIIWNKKSKVKMKNTKKDFEINGVKAKQKISF